MTKIIEIKDKDAQGGLAIELPQILDLLEPEGRNLCWAILDLEATGCLSEGENMLDLEQEIQQSPRGVILTWDKLISYSQAFFQVINTIIVACREPTYIPKLHPDVDLYTPCEIVIEAIDSSLWSIYAKDDYIIRRFQSTFQDVNIVTLE